MLRYTVSIVLLSLLCCFAFGEVRTWTDSTGKHKRKAEFVSFDGETVILKSSKGKTLKIPLNKLSKADQTLAKRLAKESKTKSAESSSGQTTQRKSRTPRMINQVRAAPYRAESMSKLRQISLALNNYQTAMGRYPTMGTTTASGKPGLSWRVAILPYLEEGNLFNRFNRKEPWDSPHNKKLLKLMPKIFSSPGGTDEPGMTNYLAVASPDSIIRPGKKGSRMADIRDGTSKTLLIVEADDSAAVEWTKPADYEWTYENPSKGLGHIWPGGQFLGAYADSSVHRLYVGMGNDALIGLFTRSGRD